MGTKNNPGEFDCFTSAAPDEPIFVLLGRDKHAPLLVQLWAALRQADGEERAKVVEAQVCATEMAIYCGRTLNKEPLTLDHLSRSEATAFTILASAPASRPT